MPHPSDVLKFEKKYSEYLQELTLCLSQSIVLLLKARPQDPIEFLAYSLKLHRKKHPIRTQGKELIQTLDDHSQDGAVSPCNLVWLQGAGTTQQANIQEQTESFCSASSTDNADCCGLQKSLFKTDFYMTHKDDISDFLVFGDLYDDDDVD